MKIAFIGLKGLPAKVGGLQFDAENIAKRLVKRGHKVYAYSRRWYSGNIRNYEGINIIITPSFNLRYTDALTHSFTSSIHAIFNNYDVIHFFSYASYFFIPLLRLFDKKVVIRLNGIPWGNISYNSLGRVAIGIAYHIGMKYANIVTAESLPLKEMAEKEYNKTVIVTPVGSNIKDRAKPDLIESKFNLKQNSYILFLGRLERGKRVDWLIKGFKEVNSTINLIVAGDTNDIVYKNYLYEISKSDERIIFTGLVNGRLKEELLSNCLLFVLPSVSEGMSTALIEAMSYGRTCLVSDIEAHRWIIEDSKTGFLFEVDNFSNFSKKLKNALILSYRDLLEIGNRAKVTVRARFNWDSIIDTIEKVYISLNSH